MKQNLIHLMMTFIASISLLSGCSLFNDVGVGRPVTDVQVLVAEGYSIEKAILSAANRRRWTPVKTSENSYRLTIHQRSNICSVDVVFKKDSFSLLPVQSNITVRKYDQWVNNLQREILHRANLGK